MNFPSGDIYSSWSLDFCPFSFSPSFRLSYHHNSIHSRPFNIHVVRFQVYESFDPRGKLLQSTNILDVVTVSRFLERFILEVEALIYSACNLAFRYLLIDLTDVSHKRT